MEIKINLGRDSSNTALAGQAIITKSGSDLRIELSGPDRIIEIDAENLLQILNVLF